MKVAVTRATEESDLQILIKENIQQFFSPEVLSELRKVVIKPNLCALMSPESGATTDADLVQSLILVLKEYAPKARIILVESDSFERSAEEAFKNLGYEELKGKHDIELMNLSRTEKIVMSFPKGGFLKKFDLPLILLDCDFFVSVAKLKTHLFERYSGVLKNQFGYIPDRIKSKFHPFLSQVIADINSIITPDFCILDGVTALQGKGPTWGGRTKRMNVLLFSNDAVALDTIGSKIMEINPKSIPHLVAAYKAGVGTMKDIQIVGERLNNVNSKFETADRYTYYSCRMGLFLQRMAKRFEQWGDWMIKTQWKHSRIITLLPEGFRRFLKKS